MPPEDTDGPRAARFLTALRVASEELGFIAADARPLRLHGSGIYVLPSEGVVARVVDSTAENRERAATAVRVTEWLAGQGFPCVRPVREATIEATDCVITCWEYLPQPQQVGTPAGAVLGRLLRELHALPDPPFGLPKVRPLARLRRAMALDACRDEPVLGDEERAFLEQRMTGLEMAYAQLDFPLGRGLVHNDAHPGNLLVALPRPDGYVLADWDGAAYGPREIDLVQEGAPGNRFGTCEEERRAFSVAYGYDLATWPGWRTLRDLRDLHSLAAYVRTAPTKPAAWAELAVRLETLRVGGMTRQWRAVR